MNIKNEYKGIFYIVLSAFCFAVMNMFVRMAGDLPSIQKSFFRNLVAVVFAGILLIRGEGGFRWQKRSNAGNISGGKRKLEVYASESNLWNVRNFV